MSEGERPQNTGWLVFLGWVILLANELDDYFNYYREGGGELQELGHCPLFTFYGWPQNCLGTGGYVL